MLDTKIGRTAIGLLVLICIALGVVLWLDAEDASDDLAQIEMLSLGQDNASAVAADGAELHQLVQSGRQGRFVGSTDDGARLYEIDSATLEPRQDGAFDMTGVEAWIYSNGWRFRATAERATLLMPDADEGPQEASLAGNVTLDAWQERGTPSDRALPRESATLKHAATMTTQTLTFDSTLGSVAATDTFLIDGVFGAIQGPTLRMQVGDANQRPRLLSASIIGAGDARIDLDGADTLARDTQQPAPAQTTPSSPTSTADDPALDLPEIYHARWTGGGSASMAGASIASPSLDLFARLTGGELPGSAIADLSFAQDRTTTRRRSTQRAGAQATAASQPRTVHVTWDDRFALDLTDTVPDELTADDLVVKAAGDATDRVRIDLAGAQQFQLAADAIAYFATTRRTSIRGTATPALLRDPQRGEIELASADVDLTNGVTTVHGPGVARAIAQQTSLAWQTGADIAMTVLGDHAGAQGQWIVDSATFAGDIVLEGHGHRATADTLEAQFRQVVEQGVAGARLQRATLRGRARAATSDNGIVEAGAIEVAFNASDPHAVIPIAAAARFGVMATADGNILRAANADVTLEPDPDGDGIIATAMHAEGTAEVTTPDGWRVLGDTIDADLTTTTATITGKPATLARAEGESHATISADQIHLRESDGRMLVRGPGRADWRSLNPDQPATYDTSTIAWTDSLTYHGESDRIEVAGAVDASGIFAQTRRHSASGDRLIIDLAGEAADAQTTDIANLRRIQLLGAPAPTDDAEPTPAIVETRTLGATMVSEIRAERIDADVQAQRIDVNSPGRLVYHDEREQTQAGAPGAPGDPGALDAQAGTTVFHWKDTFTFDRAAGQAEMHGGVNGVHIPLGTNQRSRFDAAHIRVRFEEIPGTTPADSADAGSIMAGMRPTRVEAEGAVYISVDGVEIICDRFEYDVQREIGIADARGRNQVSIQDNRRGASTVAQSIEINLRTGAWKKLGRGTVGR